MAVSTQDRRTYWVVEQSTPVTVDGTSPKEHKQNVAAASEVTTIRPDGPQAKAANHSLNFDPFLSLR